MNPQLSATDFPSIRNWASGTRPLSIRNYPQPNMAVSATKRESFVFY
jgi:hypothetical protein